MPVDHSRQENKINAIIREDAATISMLPLPWSRLKSKRILVTGGYGFLPAYMIDTMQFLNDSTRLDCEITALVRDIEKAKRRFPDHIHRNDLKFIEADVTSGGFGKQPFDVVIHAASNASPKVFLKNPVATMTANILGAQQLLNAARDWDLDSFLYFSSGEVYGQVTEDQTPIAETQYGYIDVTAPRSCYAIAKQATEALGIAYFHQYGIPFKIVRPFHTYGPGMSLDDGRVFADFVRNAVRGEDILMNSDGRAVRAFCYLRDAAAAYFTVLLQGLPGIAYNVGNPDGAISIRDLASLVLSLGANPDARVVCNEQSTLPGQRSPIASSIPCIDRIRTLGWRPSVTPRDGFERTIQYYRQSQSESSIARATLP